MVVFWFMVLLLFVFSVGVSPADETDYGVSAGRCNPSGVDF